ncbi:MAG: flippase [Nitrospirota bacterium]|nr:flippase [Nitrospirota bacterium]
MEKTLFEKELSKVAKNAGYGGIGILVSSVIAYFSSALVARVIGAELYGVFILASTVLGVGGLFAMFGLNQGLLRYVSMYFSKHDPARMKGSIIFSLRATFIGSLFVGIVIFLLSPVMSEEIFHKPELSVALKVLVAGLPFSTLAGMYLTALQGLQLIKFRVLAEKILQPLFRVLLLVVLFLSGLRLFGVLWATVVSQAAGFAMAFYFFRKNSHHYISRSTQAIFENRRILNFSIPLFFDAFFYTVIGTIDILMLGYFLPSSEVGIYAVALKVGLLVLLPLTAFNMIFAPMISNLYNRNEKEVLERLFKTVTKWIFTISFGLFLVITLFSRPILNIFGRDFIAGNLVLVILALGRLIDAAAGSVGYILVMTGRPKINLVNTLTLCVVTITLNLLLIPRYGITGAAVGTAFSIIFINILRLFEVYYLERIHPYKKTFLKPVVSGILSAVMVFTLGRFFPYEESIFLSLAYILLFFVSYTIFLRLFILDDEDKYIINLIGKRAGLVSR